MLKSNHNYNRILFLRFFQDLRAERILVINDLIKELFPKNSPKTILEQFL